MRVDQMHKCVGQRRADQLSLAAVSRPPAPQVLRYFGWFGEPVPDSPLEAWRARKVCLLVSEGRRKQGCRGTPPSSLCWSAQ